ncbi:hypothetical protein MNBD_ALPHA11-1334 [hydrothermal vent metagenome]|uniref:Uncharacterized protein n=1 Tax=hydrothermal vent metagenome TaxID=652676 RepID=A0A3B0TZL8_9ZZZZ
MFLPGIIFLITKSECTLNVNILLTPGIRLILAKNYQIEKSPLTLF